MFRLYISYTVICKIIQKKLILKHTSKMFLSLKSLIFIVSSFFIVCQIQVIEKKKIFSILFLIYFYNKYYFIYLYFFFPHKADKTYELQLHKYLVGNIDTKYGILKQDLKKGTDKYSFNNPINSTSKDGVSREFKKKK